MNQKGQAGILILIGILIIAAVAGGAYYLGRSQPTTTSQPFPTPSTSPVPNGTGETANWKTYTDSYFSLKLPEEWKKENQTSNPIQFSNYDKNNMSMAQQKGSYEGLLKLEIYRDSTTKTLKDYVIEEKYEKFNITGKEMESRWDETEINIDGQPAIRVKTDNPGFAIYVKNPKSQEILSMGYGLDFDNHPSLADQILSTFKFID